MYQFYTNQLKCVWNYIEHIDAEAKGRQIANRVFEFIFFEKHGFFILNT